MSREQAIRKFNEKTNWISIEPSGAFDIKDCFSIFTNFSELDPSFIDELIKELTEAKQIMETKR